jgi:AcrR family transcriptional regulator
MQYDIAYLMQFKTYRPHLSTAQDARAVRTRASFRDALLALLKSTPLDQITIRDIAAEAGVSYTTFFRHYPTREALLSDIATEEMRNLLGLTLPMIDGHGVQEASGALFDYVNENRTLWSTLLTGGAGEALRTELLRASLEIAAVRSAPQDWPPPDIATLLVVSGTIEVLTWWLRQDKRLPAAKVADIHYRFVLLPILQAAETPTAPARRATRSGANRPRSR